MEGLGRLFNLAPKADGNWVRLDNSEGVTFLGYLASTGDVFTLQEAKDAAGTGAQNLVRLAKWWLSTGDGTDAWTAATQAALATITTTAAAAQSAMACYVDGTWLSDTYKYVKLTSTGAATVTAITHDLYHQRTPSNLPALGV